MDTPTILIDTKMPSKYYRYLLEEACADILIYSMEYGPEDEPDMWEEIKRTPTYLLIQFLEDV